jgi:hypothetical protein
MQHAYPICVASLTLIALAHSGASKPSSLARPTRPSRTRPL